MNLTAQSFLAGLRTGEPVCRDNLSMVPLFHDQNIEPDYITLKDGIENALLFVEEVDDEGSVNDILLRNKSDKKALLFEGEEVLGAMQNRILNVSILASGGSKQKIPVSCVEEGRWHHEADDEDEQRFHVADRMHYASGRAAENRAVNRNLESKRGFRGDQGRVWSDIEEKSMRLQAESPTSASDAMYVSTKANLDKHVAYFKHAPAQIGSVFLIHNEVAGLEVFASEKTHASLLPRLIKSYALDAVDQAIMRDKPTPDQKSSADTLSAIAADVRTKMFLDQLKNAWTKQFDGVSLGQNIRFRHDNLTGGALIHDNVLLHMCAFATTS